MDSEARQEVEQAAPADSVDQQHDMSQCDSSIGHSLHPIATLAPAEEVEEQLGHTSQVDSNESAAVSHAGANVDKDDSSASTASQTAVGDGSDVTSSHDTDPDHASTAGDSSPTPAMQPSTAVEHSRPSKSGAHTEPTTAAQDVGHLPAVVCHVRGGERESGSMQSSPIYGVATAASQAFTPTQNRLAQNAKQGVHHLEIESSPQLYFGCMAWYILYLFVPKTSFSLSPRQSSS